MPKTKEPYKLGDTAICKCGQPIHFVGTYWEHTTGVWRHLAIPAHGTVKKAK